MIYKERSKTQPDTNSIKPVELDTDFVNQFDEIVTPQMSYEAASRLTLSDETGRMFQEMKSKVRGIQETLADVSHMSVDQMYTIRSVVSALLTQIKGKVLPGRVIDVSPEHLQLRDELIEMPLGHLYAIRDLVNNLLSQVGD